MASEGRSRCLLRRPAHTAGTRDIEPAQLCSAGCEARIGEQLEEGLQRRAEVVALPHQQIEALDAERNKPDTGCGGHGPGGDAAIGMTRADA